MKRIIDDDSPVRDLVQALQDRPADPFLEDRVLGRIQRGGRRPVRMRLRPAGVVAAVAVVALASAASAMIWRGLHAPAPVPPPIEQHVIVQPTVAPPVPVPVEVAPPPEPKHHVERKPVPQAVPVVQEALPVVPVAKPAAAAPDVEESRLLLEAYRALRRDHDDDLALGRVDEYLRRFPKGALAEEALVIALDATKRDPERARTYARTYLTRFPEGEHAARAKSLVDGK